ncbi:MAG: MFS transporter [Dehalococcoidia bacterium]|nr:MFS transporter [Dehalococcoidia bacterium]
MTRLLTHGQAKQVERSLKLSVAESTFYGGMVGFGESFVGVYAVALRATAFEIGLLTALPTFMGAMGHALSFRLARLMGTRKRTIILFAALQGVMWLPILAIGKLDVSHPATLLVICVVLYVAFSAVVVPCWGSIMGEAVPPRLRGRYFSRRSRVSTLSTLVASLLGGMLIYLLRDHGLTGFVVAFGAAFCFRAVSVLLLRTLMELHTEVKSEDGVPFRRFLGELHRTNLGKAMLLLMLMNFGVNLASPFFTPYMLRDLHMSYLSFTLLSVLTPVGAVFTVTHWGTVADRFGNRFVLVISSMLISLIPLLWLASASLPYLALVQVFSGFVWAGFNLASANFLYDATTDQTRTAQLALFNAGAAASGAVGALAGGALEMHLPALLGSAFLTLCLMSGCARLAAGLGLVSTVREVRRVTRVSAHELFTIMLVGRTAHHHPLQVRMAHLHAPAGDQNSTHHKERGDQRAQLEQVVAVEQAKDIVS